MRRSVQYSQNFLRDPRLVEALVSQSGISQNDTVLDIGAGSGSITRTLAAKAGHVIAYEADERLATKLVGEFIANPNVQIVMGDFLASAVPTATYKVFANIPFNKTSDIVHKLLDSFNPPIDCFLIIQHEAALKFAGAPNRQTLFSALHGPWLRTEIVHTFQAHDFVPAPKVTAVLLRIEQRDESLVPTSESEIYRDFVSYIFNHANPNILPSLKQLFSGKNFDASEQALGNKLTAKPSQLEIHDWITLFRAFMATASNSQHQLIVGASVKQQREAASLEKHHRTRLDKNWRSTSKPKGR